MRNKQNASDAQVAAFLAAGRSITRGRTVRAKGTRYFAMQQRSKHAGKPNYMRGKRVA